MKLQDLLRDTDISLPDGWGERDITAITCDSRRVEAGCLFVCIDGTAVDAHRFAPQAQRDGAVAIVVQRDVGLSCQLMTAHTRKAWAQICANWFGRPATRLRMIGVTGTNGKTTTSTLVKSMLEYSGRKVGLIGTIQNMIGDTVLPSGHTTPDSYDLQKLLAQMADEGCDCCVMEVSSHALHQHRVDGCIYEVGVFTNLTQDHLDYHGTMEEYLAAKKRLFAISRAAILNEDDRWYDKTAAGIPCPITTYGMHGRADVAADEVRFRADGVDFRLTAGDESRQIAMQIPGRFSVYNGLAAASTCLQLGMNLDTVAAALSAAQGVKGRAEVVPTQTDFTVVIDYAHTPDGLENICRTLKDCCTGRLITLFGCGGDRDKGKRPQMAAIAADLSDYVVVTSDNPRTEDPMAIIRDVTAGLTDTHTPYDVVENRVEAIRHALRLAQTGDTVLLAGKGHETYQILASGTIHLDEREVVAEALAAQRKD